MSWQLLEQIYADYKEKNYTQLQKLSSQLVEEFNQKKNNMRIGHPGWGNDIHVIYGRAKEPEHMFAMEIEGYSMRKVLMLITQ